ncbi:unnamed protein product [Vitrella brassicaformis CCMP3155]|uniref:EB1 C-terminal domain-containing protein n=1 Tax=Vitrella brassicaformis (strain CCMP3155) TaxID=1169540 RepID=A0A0G4GPQ2_VITBC|nr:unnamed protein product [Vitrella brassicaformis CCMP3155]|eukprot:CEM32267.1 unnamed protein product [Vitrella brassicaformis CCMP3155]
MERAAALERELQLRHIIMLRERNIYLDKLRMLERFGESRKWTSDDPVMRQTLAKLKTILYAESTDIDK